MTTTTNTNGVIAAAAQTKPQEAPAKATPAQMLNSLLNNGAIQQTLKSTLDKNGTRGGAESSGAQAPC